MKKLIIFSLIMLSASAINAQVNRTDVLQDLEKNQPAVQNAGLTATLKSASRLFGAKDDLTTVILIIPSGSEVDVIDSDSTYLNVIFEENEGYIFKRHAVINKVTVVAKPVAQPSETIQEEQAVPQQQVSRFTYLENKYGSNMAAKLISGKIWKGMTAKMVRDSWGKAQKINRIIASNNIKEEWIYKNTWLYIENDVLVEWGPIGR
ncbi:MAG: hypothetical protein MUO72_18610 [Bacteroidales bacterium]|nr:hypothetical protein [Bacteroidales bacterium]